jgi:hypothetical protein
VRTIRSGDEEVHARPDHEVDLIDEDVAAGCDDGHAVELDVVGALERLSGEMGRKD